MKNLLSTIIAFVFLAQLPDSPQKLSDSTMYLTAYKYIVKDSLNSKYKINVSNELASTCYECFYDEFCKEDSNEDACLKHLSELDQLSFWEKTATNPGFDSLFVKYRNEGARLSFSKIIDNSLFAFIRMGDSCNIEIGFWKGAYYYYFIFESDSIIKTVYKAEVFGL